MRAVVQIYNDNRADNFRRYIKKHRDTFRRLQSRLFPGSDLLSAQRDPLGLQVRDPPKIEHVANTRL